MLLGIDIGGTALKAMAITEGGTVVQEATEQYRMDTSIPGHVEVYPEVWWHAFCKTLRQLWASVPPHTIKAIAFSSTNATCGIDVRGEIVLPGVLFLDQRSMAQCEEIQGAMGNQSVLEITGNRIMPGTSSLPTILWFRKHLPEDYRRVWKFLFPSTYLIYRLTGQVVVDRSRAMPSLLYDFRADAWSDDICKRFSVDPKMMPELREPLEVIGNPTRHACEETGLNRRTAIVVGGNDTACSALGVGLAEAGMACDDSGTASVLAVCAPLPHPMMETMMIPHVLPHLWLSVAPMSFLGASVNWFKEHLWYSKGNTPEEVSVYDLILAEAAESSPGAQGLIFLPYLLGDRAPIWDPAARGVFFGLSLNHRRSHMIRAILESAGYGLRWNLEIIEQQCTRVSDILAVGGQARSAFWTQLKADITQKRFCIPAQREAAAFGAAILAGGGVAVYADIGEMAARLVTIQTYFEPRREFRKLYSMYGDLYRQLYFDLKESFQRLKNINTYEVEV